MKRREFLKKSGSAAAVVAASSVAAPIVMAAEKTYNWKMVTTWPPNLPVLQTGAERFAKRVTEVSQGRIKI
ncbi:MAG TPA: twin-arginine translocation signal domain-containing protein [Desulfobacterales bacterium]|nr:twin-arginine translocation signal domain-containing protein [Desulfobacterales bacterium]